MKISKNYQLSQKKSDLKFISTPLDIKSAFFLNNIVDCFKIAYGDNNYYDLIKTVLNFNGKIILFNKYLIIQYFVYE